MSAGDSYVRRLARCHILSFGTEGKTVWILVKERRSTGGGYERREIFVHQCGVRMRLLVGDSWVFLETLVPLTQASLSAKEADE